MLNWTLFYEMGLEADLRWAGQKGTLLACQLAPAIYRLVGWLAASSFGHAWDDLPINQEAW